MPFFVIFDISMVPVNFKPMHSMLVLFWWLIRHFHHLSHCKGLPQFEILKFDLERPKNAIFGHLTFPRFPPTIASLILVTNLAFSQFSLYNNNKLLHRRDCHVLKFSNLAWKWQKVPFLVIFYISKDTANFKKWLVLFW